MTDDWAKQLEETRSSLERVQTFDPTTLAREASLGDDFNFKVAVEPAEKAIALFQQLPIDALRHLPKGQLSKLMQTSDSFYNVLQQLMKFRPKDGNASETHQSLLTQVRSQHEQVFNQIFDLIAYGASRQIDIAALQRDFGAAIQNANDRADQMTEAMTKDQEEAARILADIRKVAAEQGVSQKAFYFSQESTEHNAEAEKWGNWTIWTAAGLGAYAIASIFIHKIDWLSPKDTYETVQLTVSKVLIFAVIAYMLVLFAKNYLAHKHNAIVNKHRQNALLTFKALVDAAGTEERRDVILTYAAACIFLRKRPGTLNQAKASNQSCLST